MLLASELHVNICGDTTPYIIIIYMYFSIRYMGNDPMGHSPSDHLFVFICFKLLGRKSTSPNSRRKHNNIQYGT